MAPSTLFVGPLDRVLHLRALAPLEHLTAHQLSVLARYVEEVSWAAGSTVYRPGEPVDACYVIVDGRISMRGAVNRDAGPRETIGFLDQVARTTRGLDAVAQTETLALRLDWDAQLEICEQHFWVLWQYIRYLAKQLAARNVRVAERTPAAPLKSGSGLLNFAERMLTLGTTGVFPSNSMDAIAELARHVAETTAEPPDRLWVQGSPANEFWLVASGEVQAIHDHDIEVIGAGAAAGMFEALAGMSRRSDAVVSDAVRALRISVEPFTDILEDHFEMGVDFMSSLARLLLPHVWSARPSNGS